MKKLNIVVALFLTGFILYLHKPAPLNTYALLSEPSSYHFKYKAVNIGGVNSWYFTNVGVGSYAPTYNRSADSGYWNYTTTMQDPTYTPFPITLTFNRSNTPWYDTGFGWLPNDTAYIGSNNTVGNVVKISLTLNNNTNKRYRIYLDLSSSSDNLNASYFIDNFNYHFSAFKTTMNYYEIGAYESINFQIGYTYTSSYLDAFYLQDLGVPSAYNNGFTDGEDEGFLSGYEVGYNEGNTEGYEEGQSNFFYGDYGIWDGLIQESVPWLTGYNSGYNMANPTELIGGLITAIFTGMAPIFGIIIVGGITFGSFIIIPLSQTVLSWFFRTFGGGK